MPTIGPFFPHEGLSTDASAFSLPPRQASILSDFTLAQGVLKTRPTLDLVDHAEMATFDIQGLAIWSDPAEIYVGSANVPTVVAVVLTGSGYKIYSGLLNSTPSVTFTDKTGTYVCAAMSNIYARWTFASLGGKLVGAGGSAANVGPFKISAATGNAAALGGTPPKGDCVYVVNNFMFIARDISSTANYSKVYWSNPSDPETWPAASNLTFRDADGDIISALSSIGNNLIIFKQNSTGMLSTVSQSVSGTVTLGPLTTISETIGCAGPLAVDKLPDGRIVFVSSHYHAYIFDGNTFQDISKQPYPEPGMFSAIRQGDTTTNSMVIVRVNPLKGLVYFFPYTGNYTGASPVQGCYAYNYIENSWVQLSYWDSAAPGVNQFSSTIFAASAQQHQIKQGVYGGTSNGKVFFLENELAVGPMTITSTFRTPVVEMSILLPETFVPRMLIVPATITYGTLTATVGYNGTYESAALTTSTLNPALWQVFDIRSSLSQIPRPQLMQVKLQLTPHVSNGANGSIYPFYISDEVPT